MQAVTPRTTSAKGRAPVQIPDLLSILTRLKPALIADLDKPQLAALVAEAALHRAAPRRLLGRAHHQRRHPVPLRQRQPAEADHLHLVTRAKDREVHAFEGEVGARGVAEAHAGRGAGGEEQEGGESVHGGIITAIGKGGINPNSGNLYRTQTTF